MLRLPLTAGGVARIDMREAAADYRALEAGELYRETEREGFGPAEEWSVEGGDTLVLPVDQAAVYTVYYRAYAPRLTASTPDDQDQRPGRSPGGGGAGAAVHRCPALPGGRHPDEHPDAQ